MGLWSTIFVILLSILAIIFITWSIIKGSVGDIKKKTNKKPKKHLQDVGIAKPAESPKYANTPTAEDAHGPLVYDCTSKELDLPDRTPSAVDAVFIDLIRQAAELPSAVLELSRMLREPDVPVRKVADMVSTDPVLSARILRVANSAAVGRGNVRSIQKAIIFLGFNQIWMLVNQMVIAKSLQPIGKMSKENIKALWLHAALTSACAKHLLLAQGLWNAERAATTMTSALLHDVGKFLIGVVAKGQDNDNEGNEPVSPLELEVQKLGTDHCRIAYLLTTYWGLPEEICTAVAYHHHGGFSNWQDIPSHVLQDVAFIAVSDYLANRAFPHKAGALYKLPEPFLKETGFDIPLDSLLDNSLRRELKITAKLISEAHS